MSYDYDIAIIGGGPAGYVAAIRAAQLGFKVACIEKRKTLGGTCLNEGCIPSKILLHATARFHELAHLEKFGIHVKSPTLKCNELMAHKDQTVQSLCDGIDTLFAHNNVTRITGMAAFKDPHTLTVGKKTLTAEHIIIATGSHVSQLPGVTVDGRRILDSTSSLALTTPPKDLAIIGGGYIGLELGSVWARMGTKVTVIEYLETIGAGLDDDVARVFRKSLEKLGITFQTNTAVMAAKPSAKSVALTLHDRETKKETRASFSTVLVSIGRTPHTDKLNLDAVGITPDDKGFIPVDQDNRTRVENIYAIGDVVQGLMLAHRASDEGVTLVERIKGHKVWMNRDAIPSVIYTEPEVAQVGKTEAHCSANNIPHKIGKFPFAANSRAKSMDTTEGFVKIITHAQTDVILGAAIIGAGAGELINELTLALEMGASGEDVARTCHAHPTLSEGVREAALSAFDKALHSV